MFLSSSTLPNTFSLVTRTVQMNFRILPQNHVSKHSFQITPSIQHILSQLNTVCIFSIQSVSSQSAHHIFNNNIIPFQVHIVSSGFSTNCVRISHLSQTCKTSHLTNIPLNFAQIISGTQYKI